MLEPIAFCFLHGCWAWAVVAYSSLPSLVVQEFLFMGVENPRNHVLFLQTMF